MPEKNNPAPANIWQKLFLIQKSLKTFAVSEDSDKKNAAGKAEYKYTPGWEIVETIRKEMDKYGLMLIPNCKSQENKLIEYLVYKDFHGQAMSFSKKEMFVQVEMEFTWMDTQTGEIAGPYISYGYGANGTDKSGASAMSMAERYFLLRFFHFTTREQNEEQDAHDAGNIPGFNASQQPQNLTPQRSAQAVPAPAPWVPGSQPAAPAGAPFGGQPAPTAWPQNYGGGYGQMPQAQQARQAAPAPVQAPSPAPAPAKKTAAGSFNESDPAIQAAIAALMTFEKGTAAHQRCLNEQLGKLSALGYQCMNNEFLGMLTNTAQAFRNGTGK